MAKRAIARASGRPIFINRVKAGYNLARIARKAAKRWNRSCGIVRNARRPIDNRPQVTNLPHKIVAAREEGGG